MSRLIPHGNLLWKSWEAIHRRFYRHDMKLYTIPLLKSLFLAAILLACGSAEKSKPHYTEYNLDKPDKFNMPESLFEISGIAFNNEKSDTVYAIQDEEGKLFRLAWDVKVQTHTKFAKKGDYEDLSIINGQAIILKSNGTLFSFPIPETGLEEVEGVKEYKKRFPKGEYEGMYGDEKTGDIYVICKNCPADDSKKSVSGYIVNLDDSTGTPRTFNLDVNQIKAVHGKVDRGFRPSAIAKNPINNKWYIISAVNKLLVITNSKWQVEDAVSLSSNVFTQPEGIAFDKDGNMYISNEGDDFSDGNILKFVRQKNDKGQK